MVELNAIERALVHEALNLLKKKAKKEMKGNMPMAFIEAGNKGIELAEEIQNKLK